MTASDATSIFQRAMGAEFDRLHPQIRTRFSVGVESGTGSIGRGVMTEIWHAGTWIRPFLALGASRHILVPRRGRGVPFVIENLPYVDSYGREAVTFARTFAFPQGAARFDATMVHDADRGCIVDYVGTHQHLITDLHLSADDEGGLVIRSGVHRFHEGPLRLRVPEAVSGEARVREWYDDDARCFRIEVALVNRWCGRLFGYRGTFQAERVAAGAHLRADLRPVREHAG